MRTESLPGNAGTPSGSKAVTWIVIVAALGYFVDIYDLLLFSIIRVPSLKGIGITDPAELTQKGLMLLNIQMAGMLIGGFCWGILADKKGRLQVLFGSILLYSVANILNGFVHDLYSFSVLRLLAGLGLAGELGAGITLVTETMSASKRGYGTMIVAGVGLTGAVAASLVANIFDWRTSFFIGGGLGLLLLVMRMGVMESGMFKKTEKSQVRKGDLSLLFGSADKLIKYICCVLVALPNWFIIGILITLGPEFGRALGIQGAVNAGKGILFTYAGIALGDLLTGYLSQVFKSRKKIIAVFLVLTLAGVILYLNAFHFSLGGYYLICFYLGLSTGFWVLFVTLAAEQFGTNLRATVTTSVPNLIRGSLIPITFFFAFLKGYTGILNAALVIGCITVGIALFALSRLKETFEKELDYHEI